MIAIPVVLTIHEINMGATAGVWRRLTGIRRERTKESTAYDKDYGWHSDIEGACAEVAFAKHFNLFWDGSVNTFKAPDVGVFQVRHTKYHNGKLVIRDDDKPEETFVLVTGEAPTYTIRGGISGRDGMLDKYLDNPGDKDPAWFVPQQVLEEVVVRLYQEEPGANG